MSLFKKFFVLAAVLMPLMAAHAQDTTAPENRLPYISTYYVQPKVNLGTDAVIKYYVTSYDQKEYMKDDHSDKFTINYSLNGVAGTVPTVGAGDNSLTLKAPPLGDKILALQATDAQGRSSRRLFILFRVVNPADNVIPNDKILSPDLAKFGIFKDDTHPVETSKGLTEMLKWAGDNGYRKVVLPLGRYRLDENATVEMVSHLILDMNGSTFKLNPNNSDHARMMDFKECDDSHVINGTFEGDLKEHDFKTAPHNSEWVCGVDIGRGSKYCSYENITVTEITGYGTTCGAEQPYNGVKGTGPFALGDIDAKGQPIASTDRSSNGTFVDVSQYMATLGYFQFGQYLGYQGNATGTWEYKAHFYDADKNYIGSMVGCHYRRMYPPRNTHFAKFTLFSPAVPKQLSVYTFQAPYNCAFINVKHKDVRCVGMATAAFNNLLVEGCTFENCGFASAKCAFDAEDGWDMMQDLTFRNNAFLTNPHNEYLLAGGHNFVMEGNTMATYVWDRNNSYVFRNNKLKKATFRFGTRARTGYPRVYDNTIAEGTSLATATATPTRQFCIRDNVCNGGVTGTGSAKAPGNSFNAYFYKCKISDGNLTAKVVDCDLNKLSNLGGAFDIENSTLSGGELRSSGPGSTSYISGSTLTGVNLRVQSNTLALDKNTLTDVDISIGPGWSPSDSILLTGNKISTSLPFLISIGNTFHQILLQDNTINSSAPQFAAVRLANPALKVNGEIALYHNAITAKSGYGVQADRPSSGSGIFTLALAENTFNGVKSYSANLDNTPVVNIVNKRLTAP